MSNGVLASSHWRDGLVHVADRSRVESDDMTGSGYASKCLRGGKPKDTLPIVPTDSELEKGRAVRRGCVQCKMDWFFQHLDNVLLRNTDDGGVDPEDFENVPDDYTGPIVVVPLPEGGDPVEGSYRWKEALEKEAPASL